MSNHSVSSVEIKPVSDPAELHALFSIFDMAMQASQDGFRELLIRYQSGVPYQEIIERLQVAFSAGGANNPAEQHFVFKAVETVPGYYSAEDGRMGRRDNPGGMLTTVERIVGMAHWTVGYIDIPKVDPFEQQRAASASTSASAPASTVTEDSTEAMPLEEPIAPGGHTATYTKLKPEPEPFDFYAVCRRPVRNIYISQIRGKKHVYLRQIAVHPNHQRRGIARRLLQWGLDRADSEKLVSYLNGRPQARRLYEHGGFKAVNIVPMPVPGLEVADMITMVRQPQPLMDR